MAIAHLGSIAIDCDAPTVLAAFGANLLDGATVMSTDKFVTVKLPHITLTAIRVADFRPPSWPDDRVPKQIHLDLAVRDLDVAQRQAIPLGARAANHQPAPDKCRVTFDPAGRPFCLCLPPTAP